MRPGFITSLIATFFAAGAAAAQNPAPATAAPQAAAQAAPQAARQPVAAVPSQQAAGEAARPTEAYSYNPDGRRDPFLSLLGAGGAEQKATSRRGDGAATLTLGEIAVRGIVQSRGSLVAMVEGPDKKTYIVHTGDKLADGTIRSITPQGLIVIQEVNDPLSLVKQREVRKLLRSPEDAKE